MIFENIPKRKKVVSGFLLLVIAILVIVLVAPFAKTGKDNKVVNTPQTVSNSAPVRTEYKGILPPLFPQEVPVKKDDTLSQSYAKDYGSLKQSSVVLFSKDNTSSVFDFYNTTLVKDGYIISTSTRNDSYSYLVADKNGSHVEISFVDKTKSIAKATSSTISAIKTHIIINAYDRKF